MKRTFEALGTVVSVTVDDDLPDAELAWLLVAGYPDTTRPPRLDFHLRAGERPALVCSGRYETPVEDRGDLVPLFELDLYHLLVEHAPPGWLLHAAAVERDGRAIVLAGSSGAGKTTLTLALLARGWRFLTEEIVHIGKDAMVRGLERPIHATARSHAISADWRQRPYPLRGHDGAPGMLVQPPTSLRSSGPLPLHVLARIDHGPGRGPSATRLPASVGLARLWECSLRQDDAGLAMAIDLLANHAAYDLLSSSVSQAVDLVEHLAIAENH